MSPLYIGYEKKKNPTLKKQVRKYFKESIQKYNQR